MENVKITKSVSLIAKLITGGCAILFLLLGVIYLDTMIKTMKAGYSYIFEHPSFFLTLIFSAIGFVFLIVFLVTFRMKITITDRKVIGKTYFGRSVDLPMDSVSAVGTSWFNGIAVATSSGKIKFLFIENSNAVYKELSDLIIKRQEEKANSTSKTDLQISSTDEIKKYKDLLDSGIITQEEFDAKKKHIMGL